jgi:hypothetical protein
MHQGYLNDNQVKTVLIATLLIVATAMFLAAALELVKDARDIEASAEHTVYLPPESVRDLIAEARDIARQAAENRELPP